MEVRAAGHVTGVGGVFLRSGDPAATVEWYEEMLGIRKRTLEGIGSAHVLLYDASGESDCPGYTVWSVFHEDDPYLDPTSQPFMINFRVDDMDALLAHLKANGIEPHAGPDEWFNGRFAWIHDHEGRKIELWEPAEGH